MNTTETTVTTEKEQEAAEIMTEAKARFNAWKNNPVYSEYWDIIEDNYQGLCKEDGVEITDEGLQKYIEESEADLDAFYIDCYKEEVEEEEREKEAERSKILAERSKILAERKKTKKAKKAIDLSAKEKKMAKKIEPMIPEAIELLAKQFPQRRTRKEIIFDLSTIKFENEVKHGMVEQSLAEEVYNTLSYLNTCHMDGWLYDIDAAKVAKAIYLHLTTWDDELSKKYFGNDSEERAAFIYKF